MLYTIVGLGIIPYIYIFFFAFGKRVLNYYIGGEFIFRREYAKYIFLEVIVTFAVFFLATFILIGITSSLFRYSYFADAQDSFKYYFNGEDTYHYFLFSGIYLLFLPLLEELYWRCKRVIFNK
jgi:membrane protease YdiL (CAAX protease family)